MMPDIVYIFNGDITLGAPHYIMPALELCKKKKIIILSSITCKGDKNRYNYSSIEFIFISKKSGMYNNILYYLNFFIQLLKIRYRHGNRIKYYFQGHMSCLLSFISMLFIDKKNIIYHTQDFISESKISLYSLSEMYMAKKASTIILNEDNRARVFAYRYNLKYKPHVINTSLPLDYYNPDKVNGYRLFKEISNNQNIKNNFIVMHSGLLSTNRCGENIIDAILQSPNNVVLICMDIDNETIIRRQREIEILLKENRLYIYKELSYEEVLDLNSVTSVGLLLYPDNSVGNYYQNPGRLAEYMCCGLPIIMSNHIGLKVFNYEYNIGPECVDNSPIQIANTIYELMSNTAAHKMYSVNSKNTFINSYKYKYDITL